jgi:hypothetical protein
MPQLWSVGGTGGTHRDSRWREVTELKPGPLTLAGDLFLILLDDATGRLRVRTRTAGYALAGALLIELRQLGYISFGPDRIEICGHTAPTDPPLSRLWRLLASNPGDSDIVSWLEYLATTAVDEVADLLVTAGWIRREVRLRLSGRREVFVPRNRNAVFWRAGRLVGDLDREVSWTDLYLVGLLDAVGAVDQSLGGQRGPAAEELIRGIGEYLARAASQVAVVCGHVQVLSGRAAISLR